MARKSFRDQLAADPYFSLARDPEPAPAAPAPDVSKPRRASRRTRAAARDDRPADTATRSASGEHPEAAAQPVAPGSDGGDVLAETRPAERLVEQLTDEPEPRLVSVGTYLHPDVEDALHRAAFARGGAGEKSSVVREALDALLSQIDASHDPTPLLTAIRADHDGGTARTPRVYLVDEQVKRRLVALTAEHRIPIAASIRYALRRALLEPPAESA